jgi:hypothetical protein
MDPLSISDRLESSTPVGSVGKQNTANSDAQRRQRQRVNPKAENSEDSASEQEPDSSHQLDELA